jgi:hypothetical protein
VEAARIRSSAGWCEGTGAEPWEATPRDVALLSILEGVGLPEGWQTMKVGALISAEVRAVRPYLKGKK